MTRALDEEELFWMDRIQTTLISAGYFRARITSLPPFDKILGGLVWCVSNIGLESSNEYLLQQQDLVFDEHDSIKRKIQLSEQLITALQTLGAPFSLHSHQIQGLDVCSLFPLVQWLVKEALQARESRKKLTRGVALRKGPSTFDVDGAALGKRTALLDKLASENRPVRILRKKKGIVFKDTKAEVAATLAEYEGISMAREGAIAGDGSEDGSVTEAITRDGDIDSSKSRVGEFVEREEISRLELRLEEAIAEAEEGNPLKKEERLRALIEERGVVLAEEEARYERGVKQYKEICRMIEEQEAENEEILKEMDRIDSLMEQDERTEEYQEVQRLTRILDALKVQQKEFKAYCKAELEEMEEEIKRLEEQVKDREELDELERIHEEALKEYQILRKEMSEESRQALILSRRLEEIPSHAELLQYERRFTELHEQVNCKLVETKEYYSTYNTLQACLGYAERQRMLLQSIAEKAPSALKSEQGKENLLSSMRKIVEDLMKSRDRLKEEVEQNQAVYDQKSLELANEVHIQRSYFAAVKEFQDVCLKLEQLGR